MVASFYPPASVVPALNCHFFCLLSNNDNFFFHLLLYWYAESKAPTPVGFTISTETMVKKLWILVGLQLATTYVIVTRRNRNKKK